MISHHQCQLNLSPFHKQASMFVALGGMAQSGGFSTKASKDRRKHGLVFYGKRAGNTKEKRTRNPKEVHAKID